MSEPDDTLPEAGGDDTPPASVTNYRLGRVLGAGGMGEVVLAHDLEIGRDVALKRLRSRVPGEDAIARFVREATIQARLDHPAIVPVHALGRDADNRPFFTMKRLQGKTLHDSLVDGGHHVNRRLRAFVDVCHAIALAHERGVVHRDLKPSNIMLGNHGEVYVLDWGVARVIGEAGATPMPPVIPEADIDAATATGMLLGTPGYMSPEQVRGEPAFPPSDVYALGAILFEILAGAPLHKRGTPALLTTLDPAKSCSPARLHPDAPIPPELDTVCIGALAFDPAARPTARELAARVEAYLDGDRDLERRRTLAAEHVASARADLATGDPSRRAAAICSAGRASMLDPTSIEAADLLVYLTLAPPTVLPPELARELAADERANARARSRRGLFAYAWLLALTPLLWTVPIRDPIALAAAVGAIIAISAAHFVNWRVRYVPTAVFLVLHFVTCVMFSRLASPFLLMPTLIAAVMLAMTTLPWVMTRRWFVAAWTVAAGALPFALEAIGAFPSTWHIGDHGLVIRSDAFGELPASVVIVANIAAVVVIAGYARGLNLDRFTARRAAHIQSWQMRQLLPDASRNQPASIPDSAR